VFRHEIGDVSAARAEVDRAGGSGSFDDLFQRGEILALRVHGALDVSFGSRTELIRDDILMGSGHVLASDMNAETTATNLLQAERLSYYSPYHAGLGSKTASRRFCARPS